MTYYAVIDTNVIVSAFLKEDSIPGIIVKHVIDNIVVPLLNEEILEEYYDVLTRNRFGFDEEKIKTFLNNLCDNGIVLDRTKTIETFIDLDDVVFYEIVMTARKDVDAYLITGNLKHFPTKSYVVTPKEMLDIINNSNK